MWVGLCVLLLSCVKAQIQLPSQSAQAVLRDYEGGTFYLRSSMYETEFFGDATKKLLSVVPPDQVRLLENPDGTSVQPGRIERTLKAGSRLRIVRIEFPFGSTPIDRVLLTPRSLAWVFVSLDEGTRNGLPRIAVLRPGLNSEESVRNELNRTFSRESLSTLLEELPEAHREAIFAKRVVNGMSGISVEMSWGEPQRRVLSSENEKSVEQWFWPGARRTAKLLEGRLVDFTE